MRKVSRKLFLVFHGRFPSEKAASLFAAKSCEAFAEEGMEVVLLASRRFKRLNQDPFSYYGIKNNFKIVYLPLVDFLGFNLFGKLGFYVSYFTFGLASTFYLIVKAKRNDLIYSNEYSSLFFASFFFPNTFYEMHDFPESKLGFFKLFFNKVRWILAHNKWKANMLSEQFDVAEQKILCVPNAVEVEKFDVSMTKKEARKRLGLPTDKKISVYTGHLYGWKGVDTLALAAKELPSDHIVVFVGGTENDIALFKKKYGDIPQVVIEGFKKHDEIPVWQKAADVLVLPNTAKENISKYYTSPMKLFEYMASKRPIVASDIPSITEIVGGKEAFLTIPDNENDLSLRIKDAIEDESQSREKTEAAYAKVLEFTWNKRAKKILEFIQRN